MIASLTLAIYYFIVKTQYEIILEIFYGEKMSKLTLTLSQKEVREIICLGESTLNFL